MTKHSLTTCTDSGFAKRVQKYDKFCTWQNIYVEKFIFAQFV